MNFKFNTKIMIICLLITSLFINVFQYYNLRHYENQNQINADTEFSLAMQCISNGIEHLKTKGIDQTTAIAELSSGTSKAVAIYPLTSYYRKNPIFKNTLWEFNNNITNRLNIVDVLEKNDLSILLPTLNKIINDPTNKNATKDLDYLVKKHTVIGSTLP